MRHKLSCCEDSALIQIETTASKISFVKLLVNVLRAVSIPILTRALVDNVLDSDSESEDHATELFAPSYTAVCFSINLLAF